MHCNVLMLRRPKENNNVGRHEQGLIQDFMLGGGNHIFEEILDIFGQQNRRIQL